MQQMRNKIKVSSHLKFYASCHKKTGFFTAKHFQDLVKQWENFQKVIFLVYCKLEYPIPSPTP